MIQTLAVFELFNVTYTPTCKISWKFKPTKEDTYVAIFNPYQDEFLKRIKTLKSINILFVSEKAQNKSYTPGPRNTLVIFEKKDAPKRKSVPKVP